MIPYIYKCFSHWCREGSIYLYSDPHFSDSAMNKVRNITDEIQIKNINRKVGKKDTIIFLGDIGNLDCIRRIKGYKVLIKGNHDDKGNCFYERAVVNGVDNHLFDEVYDGALMISRNIILSHEPIDNFRYAVNIHGHNHNSRDEYNMSAENIDFTPVSLSKLIESGLNNKVLDIHRETIDSATSKKQKKFQNK